MKPLEGKIAVVTGASRGVGRGIAVVLGECGAAVYVTGRSGRVDAVKDVPGTIDDTAEERERGQVPTVNITHAGGGPNQVDKTMTFFCNSCDVILSFWRTVALIT